MWSLRCVSGLLLAWGLVSACTAFPHRFGVPYPGEPAVREGQPTPAHAKGSLSRKFVTAKQEDRNVLIARDGTWCSVSSSRYQRVRVGDMVLRGWQV